MKKKYWFGSLFDILGILSLTGAAIALGALWFVDASAESLLFKAFHFALATAIASFLIGRLVDLFRVIISTPDPRRLRTQSAADTNVVAARVEIADGELVSEGKFSRAA